jgi:hypothetical protein
VFDVVGTPRRWLWPVLWVLGRQSVVFAAWARNVPFTVTNRPANGTLQGTRTFHFATGDRTMVDLMSAEDGLVDTLGSRGQYRAALTGSVHGGALTLRSTSMRSRQLGLRLPGSVEVTERWDDHSQRQHVAVVITAPLIGRVYEYSGFFTYDIEVDHVLAP